MNATLRDLNASNEGRIQEAIAAYASGEFKSIRACAIAHSVPRSTLQHRISGHTSRSCAHEQWQILSLPEERTLVRWLSRLTSTGFPASPALAVQMAEEIRRSRIQLSKNPPPTPLVYRPIGQKWLRRFRIRHPEIQGIWTRQIEGARHKAATVEAVKPWFETITELKLQHGYPPERQYNMDESGFAVGTSQSSRALVNIREKSSWKVVQGRQEWITAIECVSASGIALPPLIIFKAKHTHSGWIPERTPADWRFSTSNSGWTSDGHGFEWLTTVFEPLARPEEPTVHRLLIADGHSSHVTARFISFCMSRAIDLLILPPHCSHELQPLDVGVFAPLKRALACETDKVSRLDSGRLSRVEWTEMYIRARDKSLTPSNIRSGWRATGLEPLSPITVLDRLRPSTGTPPSDPRTPGESSSLDLSLLHSSPPEGTELRQANTLLNSELRKVDGLASPIKRYTQRLTKVVESTQSELVTMRQQLAETQGLLRTRQARKRGKRVLLQGKYVFSTEEVHEIAKQAEERTAAKKGRGKHRTSPITMQLRSEVVDVSGSDVSEAESDCIVVACRKSS